MRNVGGSIGIAVTGTLVARGQQSWSKILSANITPYDPATQSLFAQMRAGFMAAGADAVTATNRAYAAMAGLVARQAAMVSFVNLFELLGFIFLAMLPLVLLMKRPRTGAAPSVGH